MSTSQANTPQQQGAKLNVSANSQIKAKVWCCNYSTEMSVADTPRAKSKNKIKVSDLEHDIEIVPVVPVETPVVEVSQQEEAVELP